MLPSSSENLHRCGGTVLSEPWQPIIIVITQLKGEMKVKDEKDLLLGRIEHNMISIFTN